MKLHDSDLIYKQQQEEKRKYIIQQKKMELAKEFESIEEKHTMKTLSQKKQTQNILAYKNTFNNIQDQNQQKQNQINKLQSILLDAQRENYRNPEDEDEIQQEEIIPFSKYRYGFSHISMCPVTYQEENKYKQRIKDIESRIQQTQAVIEVETQARVKIENLEKQLFKSYQLTQEKKLELEKLLKTQNKRFQNTKEDCYYIHLNKQQLEKNKVNAEIQANNIDNMIMNHKDQIYMERDNIQAQINNNGDQVGEILTNIDNCIITIQEQEETLFKEQIREENFEQKKINQDNIVKNIYFFERFTSLFIPEQPLVIQELYNKSEPIIAFNKTNFEKILEFSGKNDIQLFANDILNTYSKWTLKNNRMTEMYNDLTYNVLNMKLKAKDLEEIIESFEDSDLVCKNLENTEYALDSGMIKIEDNLFTTQSINFHQQSLQDQYQINDRLQKFILKILLTFSNNIKRISDIIELMKKTIPEGSEHQITRGIMNLIAQNTDMLKRIWKINKLPAIKTRHYKQGSSGTPGKRITQKRLSQKFIHNNSSESLLLSQNDIDIHEIEKQIEGMEVYKGDKGFSTRLFNQIKSNRLVYFFCNQNMVNQVLKENQSPIALENILLLQTPAMNELNKTLGDMVRNYKMLSKEVNKNVLQLKQMRNIRKNTKIVQKQILFKENKTILEANRKAIKKLQQYQISQENIIQNSQTEEDASPEDQAFEKELLELRDGFQRNASLQLKQNVSQSFKQEAKDNVGYGYPVDNYQKPYDRKFPGKDRKEVRQIQSKAILSDIFAWSCQQDKQNKDNQVATRFSSKEALNNVILVKNEIRCRLQKSQDNYLCSNKSYNIRKSLMLDKRRQLDNEKLQRAVSKGSTGFSLYTQSTKNINNIKDKEQITKMNCFFYQKYMPDYKPKTTQCDKSSITQARTFSGFPFFKK